MKRLKSKAQSWSIDAAIGVLIFIGAFLVVFALLTSNSSTKTSVLKDEASNVINIIVSEDSSLRVIDGKEVNESRLGQLKNLTYNELKRMLSIEGDFCIYFEDDKGNLVLINYSYKGIGAPTINLSNTPCSQK